MKRVALVIGCLLSAAVLSAQNAGNAPERETVDSPLEYYFGALALFAIVMTWAWVALRLKHRIANPPPGIQPESEPATEPETEPEKQE